jgi:2-polyprenyl-3-methyl-5-hydroxy-6-metoxy-1,4-benzoquinol methylase
MLNGFGPTNSLIYLNRPAGRPAFVSRCNGGDRSSMRDSNLRRCLIKVPGLRRTWIDLRHFGRVARRAFSSRSKHADHLHVSKAWDLETPAVHERNRIILGALGAVARLADCTVLEIGCSDGVFTQQLAQSCKRVVAIDISTTACELAQQRCTAEINVGIRHIDLESDDLAGTYDVVFAMDVLHFLSGLRRLTPAISKAVEAVAPGGLLVFSEHRVPEVQRDAWWQRILPYGADAYLQLFADHPELTLVWSGLHEPSDERYTPHLLAIYRRQIT